MDGLAQQGRSALAAGHDAGGTPGDAERARGAECLGELELLRGQAYGRFVLAEREVGERGLRTPREVAGTGDLRSGEQRADGQQVLKPLGDSSLCDPQPAAGEAKLCGDRRSLLGLRVKRRERLLGRVELALIDQRPDEHASR